MPNLLRLFDTLLRSLAALLLAGLLVCVVLGVFFRQLGHPLAWSDEMAQYFLVWCGFTGWVIASRKRLHIRIDMLINRLPVLPRRLVEIAIQLAIALLALTMLRHSFTLIQRNWDMESISVPLPAAMLYLPLPAAGLVILLQALAEAWAAARGRMQAGPDTTGQPL